MKNTLVTIAGVGAIAYAVPASLEELCNLIDKDEEKGKAIVLNAANQYFLQINLINVRNKIAETLSAAYAMEQKLWVGKTEVVLTVDNDKKPNGYKAVEGKKIFGIKTKVVKESAKEFIDRVIREKELSQSLIAEIVQEVATNHPFTATQKRVRGSVASKPVGAKWTRLAAKIINAGNGPAAAAKLSAELGEAVNISGDDAVKRLALALSDKARKAREAEEAEVANQYGGTDEVPLVVDGTTSV